MSLEAKNTSDAIGIERSTGHAILTIADSSPWDEVQNHLLALQAKINVYLEFIEGRQIFEAYPAASGRQLLIDLICRFPPPSDALLFFSQVTQSCAELGIVFRHGVYNPPG
jgi:hypothetical protein